MKIVGFPVDVSRSQDDRIVRGQRIQQSLIQATLDLIQAGDVEPGAGSISMVAGIPSRILFQHFTRLSDLYSAAFDLAVERALDPDRPVDINTPLTKRVALLASARAQLFESWRPVWHFAERVRQVAPAVGVGVAHLRKRLREHIAASFATELETLSPASRDLALDTLDIAFGLETWMNMRDRLCLSPMSATRTWRFKAEAMVQQALTGPGQVSAA